MQNARGVADPHAGPVGARPVGARARRRRGRRRASRASATCTRDPFTDAYPGFDSGAHRLRVRARRWRRADRGADDVRREGAERGLRPARRLPDRAQGRARSRTWSDAAVRRRRPASAGAGHRDRARHRGGAASGRPRPTCAGSRRGSVARSSTGRAAPRRRRCAVHRVREDGHRSCRRRWTTARSRARTSCATTCTRATLYDRNGPTFRVDARAQPARDRRRPRPRRRARAGRPRARARIHGVPIVLKDNIDVTGLPTTGGALALVDHRPRSIRAWPPA